jgi:hypothetical protein
MLTSSPTAARLEANIQRMDGLLRRHGHVGLFLESKVHEWDWQDVDNDSPAGPVTVDEGAGSDGSRNMVIDLNSGPPS